MSKADKLMACTMVFDVLAVACVFITLATKREAIVWIGIGLALSGLGTLKWAIRLERDAEEHP